MKYLLFRFLALFLFLWSVPAYAGETVTVVYQNDLHGWIFPSSTRVGMAKMAQMFTVDLIQPGVSPKYLFDANNDFLRSKGYAEETRIYAHGQGYDMVERPGMVAEETMKIQPRMFLAIHPAAVSGQLRAGICDNFLITETGEVERLHKTPQQIFEV